MIRIDPHGLKRTHGVEITTSAIDVVRGEFGRQSRAGALGPYSNGGRADVGAGGADQAQRVF